MLLFHALGEDLYSLILSILFSNKRRISNGRLLNELQEHGLGGILLYQPSSGLFEGCYGLSTLSR